MLERHLERHLRFCLPGVPGSESLSSLTAGGATGAHQPFFISSGNTYEVKDGGRQQSEIK